jgi:two-component system, OmpR family, response regulator MprA
MKAHILVVDDDPRITDLMRRILAYEGYSVTIARSGTEALDRSLERPPDLVVHDIMLLDGLEVAQRLRAAGDKLPILMLTPRGTVADRVKGLETGADDYLVKPPVLERCFVFATRFALCEEPVLPLHVARQLS